MTFGKLPRELFIACLLSAGLVDCAGATSESARLDDPWHRGRLSFRPPVASSSTPAGVSGLAPVFAGKPDDALIYVPTTGLRPGGATLLVLLHGAGGNTSRVLAAFTPLADSTGVIVVTPKSVGVTWDSMTGAIGPDVENIDRVLNQVARSYRIDPARISIGGFSDGASYALAVGRLNGTLFRHILAFSPGILLPVSPRGTPKIFISHGTADTILSIDRASRSFVPELRSQGYTVEYHEFEGPHTIPLDVARRAMNWITAD